MKRMYGEKLVKIVRDKFPMGRRTTGISIPQFTRIWHRDEEGTGKVPIENEEKEQGKMVAISKTEVIFYGICKVRSHIVFRRVLVNILDEFLRNQFKLKTT